MKKLLTLLSALAVAISLSMPVFGQETSQQALAIGASSQEAASEGVPAQENGQKKKKKEHKKSKKQKKEKKKKGTEGENP